jgi:hypothetical protein
LNNLSIYNAIVVVGGMAFMIMRIYCEEELLRQYPLYASYADKTRWRLIPSVW